MSEGIVMEGRTVSAATESALAVLGLSSDEVDVKVLEEGSSGVLGMFGSKPAKVEVCKRVSFGGYAKTYLQTILDSVGLVTVVEVISEEENRLAMDIRGDDLGRVIGKDGQLINALQELVSAAASKRAKQRVFITLDAAGYRGRRERKLKKMARDAAERVQRTGRQVALEPMSSADRRVVHFALQNHDQVSSSSEGRQTSRHVIIRPKS